MTALLSSFYGSDKRGAGGDVEQPLRTARAGGTHHGVVVAHIEQANGCPRNVTAPGHDARKPLSTATTTGSQQRIVETTLVDAGALPPEMIERATRVAAFLVKFSGTNCKSEGAQIQPVDRVLDTITTVARFAVVTVTIDARTYIIVDIGLRMLKPRELARAQGFPDNYVLDPIVEKVVRGKLVRRPLTIAEQISAIGNSVRPPAARAGCGQPALLDCGGGARSVSVIATAVKHMLAAGITGQALVAAIAEMEACVPAVGKDATAASHREKDAAYQAAKRAERKTAKTSAHRQKSAESADSADVGTPPSPNDIYSNPLPDSVVISDEITVPASILQTETVEQHQSDAPLTPDEVLEAWNDMAGRHGLPKATLTPARRKALAVRIRPHSLDGFTEAIRAVPRSPFLLGENQRGWRVGFDFFLQPTSFTKLIEGSYDRATHDRLISAGGNSGGKAPRSSP